MIPVFARQNLTTLLNIKSLDIKSLHIESLGGERAAAWPGREDLLRLRPATRVLLLGLCGWAIAALVLSLAVLLWPSATTAPGETPLTAALRAPGDPHADVAITQRPLFARTRRATAEPVPVYTVPAPVRDHAIILKGVFINGADARAFLASGSEPQGRWVAANDTIAGWTIASLSPGEVRLTAADESLTVSLHPTQGAGAMPASTAAPLPPVGLPPNFRNPAAGPAFTGQGAMMMNPELNRVGASSLFGARPGSNAPP